MEKITLTINLGSSSKRYSLYKGDEVFAEAHFEHGKGEFIVTYDKGEPQEISETDFKDSLSVFYKKAGDDSYVSIIGIRVVAPGQYFTDDYIIDQEFLLKLSEVVKLDQTHIEPVQNELLSVAKMFPDTKVIAVSDSRFHKTMTEVARIYAIPAELAKEKDLYRFGFHGLSLSNVVKTLSLSPKGIREKVIVCHLGSGASVTALLSGKSVDTSMGYSPLEGLVMSSRVGNIDVGAVLRLAEDNKPDVLQEMFYEESGLLAISEISNDMRVLLEAEKSGNSKAHLAVETFVYNIKKYVGAYASVLGGVDVIIFSGTIGERSGPIRERVCKGLEWLNVNIDMEKNLNAKSGDGISKEGVAIYVIASDESQEILERAITALG